VRSGAAAEYVSLIVPGKRETNAVSHPVKFVSSRIGPWHRAIYRLPSTRESVQSEQLILVAAARPSYRHPVREPVQLVRFDTHFAVQPGVSRNSRRDSPQGTAFERRPQYFVERLYRHSGPEFGMQFKKAVNSLQNVSVSWACQYDDG